MNLPNKDKLYFLNRKNKGFAIPQVLILGVGIAVGVSGLMAASILGLVGSRVNRQELLAKASSSSGITLIRSLLNDSSEVGLYHYFWPIDFNQEIVNECTGLRCPNPSKEYWPDDEWCEGQGLTDCYGRQKAPMCTHNGVSIDWDPTIETFTELVDDEQSIGFELDDSRRDFNQTFKAISTNYTGTEQYGVSSILIEGKAETNNLDKKITASNKLRVNIQVDSVIPEGGFGFLSVGENQSDGEESLFLGDLNITAENEAVGSIIWRRNLEDSSDCYDIAQDIEDWETDLSAITKGGIWVQPLGLPKQPRLSNVEDLGILICTPAVIQREDTNCTLTADSSSEKVYRIHSLYAKGPGSKFEISTTDNSKVILEIMGDIDISHQGIFCHRNSTEPCGSGKPQNLTILFKQKTAVNGNKIVCNDIDLDDTSGGVKFKTSSDFTDYQNPIDNDQLPGSSFLIDNTGDNSTESEKFSAFIYGPKLTFLSVRPSPERENQFVQLTNSYPGAEGAGMIVTSRSTYGWIKNTLSNCSACEDKMVNLILDSNSNLIPFLGQQALAADDEVRDIEIVGVGYKVKPLPLNSTLNPSASRTFLIYSRETGHYYLRTFDIDVINPEGQTSSEYSYPRAFAKLHAANETTNVDLGEEPNLGFSKDYLETFDIHLEEVNHSPTRNFSGAAWVKNFCLDKSGEKTWEFDNEFVQELIDWHGEQFNWGVRYYKGRSIILWDTLRDFES